MQLRDFIPGYTGTLPIENPEQLSFHVKERIEGEAWGQKLFEATGFYQQEDQWYAVVILDKNAPIQEECSLCLTAFRKADGGKGLGLSLLPASPVHSMIEEPLLEKMPRGISTLYTPALGCWILYQTNVFPIGTPSTYQGPYETQQEAWTTAWVLAGVLAGLTEAGMDQGVE
jgi:hypothetical protein